MPRCGSADEADVSGVHEAQHDVTGSCQVAGQRVATGLARLERVVTVLEPVQLNAGRQAVACHLGRGAKRVARALHDQAAPLHSQQVLDAKRLRLVWWMKGV